MRLAVPLLFLVACAHEPGPATMPKTENTPRTKPAGVAGTIQTATFALG